MEQKTIETIINSDKDFLKLDLLLEKWKEIDKKDVERLYNSISDKKYKVEFLVKMDSDYRKQQYLDTLENKIDQTAVILSMKSTRMKVNCLKKYYFKKSNLTSSDFKRLREDERIAPEYIKNSMEFLIKYELGKSYNPEKRNEKIETVKQMEAKNAGVVQKIDLRILDDKYVNLLGVDNINYISCFPKIVDKLLGLSENEFKALEMGYSRYFEKNDTKDWYFIFSRMLETIAFESEFEDSIYKKISDYSKVDSDCLARVLLNDFPAAMCWSIDEINNINKVIKRHAQYLSRKDDIDNCREAVLLKFFGIPKGEQSKAFGMNSMERKGTKWLLQAYGDGIDELEDGPYKNLLETIKLIYEIDDIETLKMLYNSTEEFSSIDIVEAESAIKKEYLKVYNKQILKPEELPVNEEGLYEAGTDFKIIMTVLGAFSSKKGNDINNIENYKNDWNRDSLASLHFCTSLISNNMLATGPRRKGSICYGFANLDEDSLLLSGSQDLYSSDHRTFGISNKEEWNKTDRTVKYYSPDKMIKETGDECTRYNEMCFKRPQHGATENNPDYVIVFKEYGEIDEEDLENARKAAKDFGGIPIVVVDVDKCLEAERKKLDNLIDEYKIDGDMAKLEQISYIIKNNRLTRYNFAKDIDLEAIEKKLESNKTKKTVSASGLKKIYENTKAYIKAQVSYNKSKEVLSEER